MTSGLGDGARRGLHRGLRRAALGTDRRGARTMAWRRRRRWGRSCARSRSGTCASSTACWRLSSRARGRRARPGRRAAWSSTSTASSARSMATPSRAPASATPTSAAITRSSPRAPDTGEVLHIRLRKGSANTSRGMLRFCDELIARVNRAGATGAKLLRADSGFWNKKTFARLDRAGWQFSIGVRMQPHVRAAIEQITGDAWITLGGLPADLDRADRRNHARRAGG